MSKIFNPTYRCSKFSSFHNDLGFMVDKLLLLISLKKQQKRYMWSQDKCCIVGLQCVIVLFPEYTHLLFVWLKIYFFISQSKHILCSHKRTVLVNKFSSTKTNVKIDSRQKKNISILSTKMFIINYALLNFFSCQGCSHYEINREILHVCFSC